MTPGEGSLNLGRTDSFRACEAPHGPEPPDPPSPRSIRPAGTKSRPPSPPSTTGTTSSEIDTLRTLYANALERQWIALRDLDWSREIDREAFANTFSMGGIPIQETGFWRGLDAKTRWEMSRRTAAFMLSNFLHGEQGALMVAAQLVSAVPHMDGKFYAATQTLDEARHVEVFAAYIRKLDEVQPIAPALKKLLDGVLAAPSWLAKAVGMQVVTEGIALYSFRDMRNQTREPLLKQLLTYVSRDEARHTGFGVKYLAAIVPSLAEREIREVEDFAFEAARLLIDSRAGLSMRDSVMSLWSQAGVDPKHALMEIAKDRAQVLEAIQRSGGRRGPVRGFVIPTLRAIGLFSDRDPRALRRDVRRQRRRAVRQDHRRRGRLPRRPRGVGREQLAPGVGRQRLEANGLAPARRLPAPAVGVDEQRPRSRAARRPARCLPTPRGSRAPCSAPRRAPRCGATTSAWRRRSSGSPLRGSSTWP